MVMVLFKVLFLWPYGVVEKCSYGYSDLMKIWTYVWICGSYGHSMILWSFYGLFNGYMKCFKSVVEILVMTMF